jgi:hypothetical protein
METVLPAVPYPEIWSKDRNGKKTAEMEQLKWIGSCCREKLI